MHGTQVWSMVWEDPTCSKFSKPGFSNTWTVNFLIFKLVLKKAEDPEIKLPTSAGSWKKAREFQKNIYFCFIDYAKACDCVDHNIEAQQPSQCSRAKESQTLKPACLEPKLCTKRNYYNKKLVHCSWKIVPTHCNWRRPTHSNEDPVQPKNQKINKFCFKNRVRNRYNKIGKI